MLGFDTDILGRAVFGALLAMVAAAGFPATADELSALREESQRAQHAGFDDEDRLPPTLTDFFIFGVMGPPDRPLRGGAPDAAFQLELEAALDRLENTASNRMQHGVVTPTVRPKTPRLLRPAGTGYSPDR